MNDLTKAQLTIGFLAVFATIWHPILTIKQPIELISIGLIIGYVVLLMILSYIIIALLEWVNVFDLKTNSALTLLVLVTFRILSAASIC